MDLGFSQEQEILRKGVKDFVKGHLKSPLAKEIRRFEQDPLGYDQATWREMAALGWMGCAIPAEYEGVGGNFIDLIVLLEEMGSSCLPGPFFSTVMSASIILDAGNEVQKKETLPAISQGELVLTLALNEPRAQWDAGSIETVASLKQGNFFISGTKLFVADANAAKMLIVAAKTGEPSSSNEGITLFLVDTKSQGLTIDRLKTIASDRKYKVVLDKVKVGKESVIGDVNEGWPLVKRVMERAAVAKCAEMVGGAQQVLNMTIQYAKDRVQFGKPIGSFQAIQQHCANMAIDVDASRFLTYEAAWTISEGLACSMEASIAKAWVSDAYKRVMRLAHQIHGAIGYTMEHDLQLYFKGAEAGALDWGDSNFHRCLIARSLTDGQK
jgi:alkylation response protein AidB-like acyl-CoA dehydrogenase